MEQEEFKGCPVIDTHALEVPLGTGGGLFASADVSLIRSKTRELIMDFIEPISIRAGTWTPSSIQKTRGWRGSETFSPEAGPTEKIEG